MRMTLGVAVYFAVTLPASAQIGREVAIPRHPPLILNFGVPCSSLFEGRGF
jgi:hypothetical protein